MRVTFGIEYRTANDETLYLICNRGRIAAEYPMQQSGDMWHCTTEERGRTIRYRYEVRRGDTVLRREWGEWHKAAFAADVESAEIFDHWVDKPTDLPLRSSMFVDAVFGRKYSRKGQHAKGNTVTIRAEIANIRPHQSVAIVGSCEALGRWDTERAKALSCSKLPQWSITLDRASLPHDFSYKFIIIDTASAALVAWEQGDDHRIAIDNQSDCTIIDNLRPTFDIEHWRGAGCAIPLFSLRSERSFGVGDFADLRLMVDWAVRTGQSIIQLLPINDTTMSGTQADSYPYNACSSFALHPQYIRLEEVGPLRSKRKMAQYESIRRRLNALSEVDYEAANRAKTDYLHEVYKEQHRTLAADKAYLKFVEENRAWLLPYAIFCTLRDKHHSADFRTWGEASRYDKVWAEAFAANNAYDVGYHCFVQYHLSKQLRAARDYAHSQGIVLKGDIPIGISPTSVDAWLSPELFNMEMSAGAPPDDFSVLGQNWGFPTYNWAKMAEDGYAWWRARFAKMAEYFDAYRIDHILGFFRIWEIPHGAKNALLGHFNPALPLSKEEISAYGFLFDAAKHTAPLDISDDVLFIEDGVQKGTYHPRITAQKTACYAALSDAQKAAYNAIYDDFFYRRHNDFWRDEAMRKLPPLLASNGMLVCGEDLGMIPDCVAEVMASEQILSLEIQRMPKAPFTEFAHPRDYAYHAVCATSTHDMSPIRLWWEEDAERSQRFYNQVLAYEGAAPEHCTTEIAERIVAQHIASPAMLAILPWQDWMAMSVGLRRPNPAEERINDPSNPHNYWCYRMHLTLEQLLENEEFNRSIATMIHSNGR